MRAGRAASTPNTHQHRADNSTHLSTIYNNGSLGCHNEVTPADCLCMRVCMCVLGYDWEGGLAFGGAHSFAGEWNRTDEERPDGCGHTVFAPPESTFEHHSTFNFRRKPFDAPGPNQKKRSILQHHISRSFAPRPCACVCMYYTLHTVVLWGEIRRPKMLPSITDLLCCRGYCLSRLSCAFPGFASYAHHFTTITSCCPSPSTSMGLCLYGCVCVAVSLYHV